MKPLPRRSLTLAGTLALIMVAVCAVLFAGRPAYSQSGSVPTPFVVTATPTPQDVFEAATRAAELQTLIDTVGTPTSVPLNWVLATQTPTPWVVTATPTAENAATATVMAAEATAIAFTTGTPDPRVVVVTSTPKPQPTFVTPTPRARDVLEEATRAAEATKLVQTIGTPTSTPSDWSVAKVVVLPNVGEADNRSEAQAQVDALIFTNAADNVVFHTATPRPPRPLPTWTPLAVSVSNFTPTPVPVNAAFPTSFVGKIMFLSDVFTGNSRRPEAFIVNPDGTGLARLSGRAFYDRAKEREAHSPDGRYRGYALKEMSGARQIQIFYHDSYFGSEKQLTYFGDGVSWDPAWSPAEDLVAFVSSESGHDEIWTGRPGEWPATKLTDNGWPWDKSPSFSPDGAQIIFMSNRDGRQQIWIMDKNGANPQPLFDFPFEAWDPVWVKYGD